MSTNDHFDDDEMTSVASRSELNAALAKRAERSRPYLVIVQSKTSVGRQIRLEGEFVIGRAANADVRLDEDGVSRAHAKLVARADGVVEIADLGSTNGTWINGERIGCHLLKDGDRIQIGNITILKFSYQDAIDEGASEELVRFGDARRPYEAPQQEKLRRGDDEGIRFRRAPPEPAITRIVRH